MGLGELWSMGNFILPLRHRACQSGIETGNAAPELAVQKTLIYRRGGLLGITEGSR